MPNDQKLIFKQIPKVMASIGAIGKDRKNPQQGYQFRGIDDLYNACNAALSEHEVFAVPKVTNISREERTNKSGGLLLYTVLTVTYTFYASDGSSFECVTIGEAMDSGDKSCNKAMSAAQKYAFLQVFSIPTEEPKDTENDTHIVAPKKSRTSTASSSLYPEVLKTFAAINDLTYLGNHYRKHFGEYQKDPNFDKIVAAKDKRKTELLAPKEEVFDPPESAFPNMVSCPNHDGRDIDIETCKTCVERQGCPSHEATT